MMTTLHLLGVFLLFAGLGALCLAPDDPSARRLGSIGHGVGLLLVLLTGIAVLVGMDLGGGVPVWIWGKIVVWLALGAAVVGIRRSPGLRLPLFFLLPVLGAIAAWLAFTRPGG